MMRYYRGFTLLELLAALAIVAILLTVAIPSWQALLANTRANAATRQLMMAINYARSEAVTGGEVVTLCKSSDFKSCGGSWSEGYIASAADTEILRVFMPTHLGDRITWQGFPSSNYVQFSPSGFTMAQNGSFYYCPENKDPRYARAVIVDQTGRARLSQEDAQGKPLQCE